MARPKSGVAAIALALLTLPFSTASQAAPQQEEAVVILGRLEKPSGWREAETEHVVVTSDGDERELIRIAHNLERLHFLLGVLTGRADLSDDTRKLRITLVGDPTEFEAMDLANRRFTPGPYRWGFESQGYYDPREDGPVLAATRFDTKVQIERGTSPALLLPSLIQSLRGGMPDRSGLDMASVSGHLAGPINTSSTFARSDSLAASINESSVPISAEGRIYAAFARNWLLTYFPNAYPRWYVDGFGELFATISVRQDGTIEYGRAPEGYAKVLNAVRAYPVKKVLAGDYLLARGADKRWTPYHAWVLAHMLFFSEARQPQLRRYLAAVAAGTAPDEAAQAFGDLGALQQELKRYDNGKLAYERMTYPPARAAEPIVRRLSIGEAAFVKGRLELASRVDIAATAALDTKTEQARQRAIARRDAWLAELRKDAGRYPTNLQAQLLLAEAECRSDHAAQCLVAAERALAADPDSSDALAWKGVAMLSQALAVPGAERPAWLKAARVQIGRANRADPANPLPLIAYYRSFADAGEAPSDLAIEALTKAVETVPAAPAPRLMLGEALVRRGDAAGARRILLPIAHGAYDTPERSRALALIGEATAG